MGLFDTRSLSEIKRDNQRLRNEGGLRDDMNRHEEERAKASKENFNLKHGGKIRMVKKVGSGASKTAGWIGKGLMAVGEQYAKTQASKQAPKRKRRVKKVKKRKKKANSFTVTYN